MTRFLDGISIADKYMNTPMQKRDLSYPQICPALHCRLFGSSVPRTQSGRRGGRAGDDLDDLDDDHNGDDGDEDD